MEVIRFDGLCYRLHDKAGSHMAFDLRMEQSLYSVTDGLWSHLHRAVSRAHLTFSLDLAIQARCRHNVINIYAALYGSLVDHPIRRNYRRVA